MRGSPLSRGCPSTCERPATGRGASVLRVCPGGHGCTASLGPSLQRPLQGPTRLQSAVLLRPSAALSTYPLIERRSWGQGGSNKGSYDVGTVVGSQAWLAASVRDIVSTLGQVGRRPFLQLVFSRQGRRTSNHQFQAVPVSHAVADNPQSWDAFAEHVRRSSANGLVLVRPIPSPDKFCVYAGSQPEASSSSCPPPATAAAPEGLRCGPAGAAAQPPGARPGAAAASQGPVLEGQVGECCEDGAEARDTHAGGSRSGVAAAGAACAAAPGAAGQSCTDYYGLVVQSSCSSEADGCWVLKVTRSDAGGVVGMCSCMHFTLTRVCLGQPLYTQLRDAWLAGPAVV